MPPWYRAGASGPRPRAIIGGLGDPHTRGRADGVNEGRRPSRSGVSSGSAAAERCSGLGPGEPQPDGAAGENRLLVHRSSSDHRHRGVERLPVRCHGYERDAAWAAARRFNLSRYRDYPPHPRDESAVDEQRRGTDKGTVKRIRVARTASRMPRSWRTAMRPPPNASSPLPVRGRFFLASEGSWRST